MIFGTGGGGALAKSGETDRLDPIKRAWRGLAVCSSRCTGRSVKVMVIGESESDAAGREKSRGDVACSSHVLLFVRPESFR